MKKKKEKNIKILLFVHSLSHGLIKCHLQTRTQHKLLHAQALQERTWCGGEDGYQAFDVKNKIVGRTASNVL